MTPSIEAAYEMGAKGGPVVEAERLVFEAWMRGHCWALCATWTGTQYRSDLETGNYVCPHATMTRRLWAAWRDRAALSNREDRAILLNLARRLRWARQAVKRARRENLSEEMRYHAAGAELEAWNSYQAAKQIANKVA